MTTEKINRSLNELADLCCSFDNCRISDDGFTDSVNKTIADIDATLDLIKASRDAQEAEPDVSGSDATDKESKEQ